MTKQIRLILVSLAAAATLLQLGTVQTVGAASDQTVLIEVSPGSLALTNAVSASGAIAVGNFSDGGAFYWMPTTGVIFMGGNSALDVSRDGHTVVGSANDANGIRQAAIWAGSTQWRLLGSFTPTAAPCDTSLSTALGTSADGSVVVGSANDGCTVTHAFRWTAAGMADLGSTVAGEPSVAQGVSGDGQTVVGSQTDTTGYSRGVRWLNGSQQPIPGIGSNGFVSTAYAANNNGSIIVGRICHPALDDQMAWMWTAQGGTMCLPAPALRPSPGPTIIVQANATSDDGSVIGGSQNVGGSVDSNAVIWINQHPAYLKDFLRANGLPNAFQTWVNTGEITGISPDGRIIVGWGAALGGFRGYIIILGSSRNLP